jgi:UDPglucose 6-dehydrogenase
MLGGSLKGKVIGLLGLAFKPNTDDMREAPSVEIARAIQSEGGAVKAYDPVAGDHAGRMMPGVDLCPDAYQAATGADALVLVTEWNEFKQLDLGKLKELMKSPIVVDGRNLYDPQVMANNGFKYRGMGRGY